MYQRQVNLGSGLLFLGKSLNNLNQLHCALAMLQTGFKIS